MSVWIDLADRAILPDRLIRLGIRYLDRKRLIEENRGDAQWRRQSKKKFIQLLRQSPIAIQIRKANQQHYELPPQYFEKVLGPHLKYSGSYWPRGCRSLAEAEEAMLGFYCERAELKDGIQILELGCGWGSLSLWMAEKYPHSKIVSVSNSHSQRKFIESQIRQRGLQNLTIITADMNDFHTDQRFDRVVSIEMFEHMRNWQQLLRNISHWLNPEGKLFVHVFSHKQFAYPFEISGDSNWMGQHFFSGGMMPSDDLIMYFQDDLRVEAHWKIDGRHYQKTAEAWLQNLDTHREEILPIMRSVYGVDMAEVWLQRWRIFFMACAELWGFDQGREWLISHYRLCKRYQEKSEYSINLENDQRSK